LAGGPIRRGKNMFVYPLPPIDNWTGWLTERAFLQAILADYDRATFSPHRLPWLETETCYGKWTHATHPTH
jgi:hypothetical protein